MYLTAPFWLNFLTPSPFFILSSIFMYLSIFRIMTLSLTKSKINSCTFLYPNCSEYSLDACKRFSGIVRLICFNPIVSSYVYIRQNTYKYLKFLVKGIFTASSQRFQEKDKFLKHCHVSACHQAQHH